MGDLELGKEGDLKDDFLRTEPTSAKSQGKEDEQSGTERNETLRKKERMECEGSIMRAQRRRELEKDKKARQNVIILREMEVQTQKAEVELKELKFDRLLCEQQQQQERNTKVDRYGTDDEEIRDDDEAKQQQHTRLPDNNAVATTTVKSPSPSSLGKNSGTARHNEKQQRDDIDLDDASFSSEESSLILNSYQAGSRPKLLDDDITPNDNESLLYSCSNNTIDDENEEEDKYKMTECYDDDMMYEDEEETLQKYNPLRYYKGLDEKYSKVKDYQRLTQIPEVEYDNSWGGGLTVHAPSVSMTSSNSSSVTSTNSSSIPVQRGQFTL